MRQGTDASPPPEDLDVNRADLWVAHDNKAALRKGSNAAGRVHTHAHAHAHARTHTHRTRWTSGRTKRVTTRREMEPPPARQTSASSSKRTRPPHSSSGLGTRMHTHIYARSHIFHRSLYTRYPYRDLPRLRSRVYYTIQPLVQRCQTISFRLVQNLIDLLHLP